MKPLPRPSFPERAAYHEAGHCAAALRYGIPVIRATIAAGTPHLYRSSWRPPANFATDWMVTLCLSGPAAEELFCGPIEDGGDQDDYAMARSYLSRQFSLQIEAELARGHRRAQRLVRTARARERIRLIADALLRKGTLTTEQIFEVALGSVPSA